MSRHWEGVTPGAFATSAVHVPVVDALADWDEAMQGRMPLAEGLARLCRAVGAECGLIARVQPGAERPLRIAVHDERRGEPVRPLIASLADDHFAAALQEARTGSLLLSAARAPGSTPGEWQAARRLRDFAVLVLEVSPALRDQIELHFRHDLPPETRSALASLVATLSGRWVKRACGLVERATIGTRLRTEARMDLPILSTANPTQLSRSEFRVCLLLSRGLDLDGVAAELGLARSTVRAHLRSIHAKTGTASLAELVFALVETRQGEGPDTMTRA